MMTVRAAGNRRALWRGGASCRALLLAALTLLSAVARADDAEEARRLYHEGETAFGMGRFLDAAAAFERAYTLSHKSQLLWNIAQAYRRQYDDDHDLGRLRHAIALYRNFIDLAPPAERRDGTQALAAAEAELRAREAAPAVPARSPVPTNGAKPTAPGSLVEAKPPAATTVTPTGVDAAESEEKKPAAPVYKKWWLWTIVGVVAAGGAAAGTAVALGQPKDTPLDGSAHTTFSVSF